MIRTLQTSLTSGMLDAKLQDHLDLAVYRNGAQKIANCRLLPQGGATRRSGFAAIAQLAHTDYQIEPFIFSDNQVYAFLFRAGAVDIWDKATRTLLTTVSGPWTAAHIDTGELRVEQQLDKAIVSHQDFETRVITRTGFSTFLIAVFPWARSSSGTIVYQPYQKYAASTITLTLSATAVGAAQATASASYFVAGHVGLKIRYRKKQLTVTALVSPTVVDVTIDETLEFIDSTGMLVPSDVADYDWDEQAFSPLRGYARSFCLHEQRLFVGGGRDCPNVVWGTALDDPFSMNLGTGADDEAIKYPIYARRVAAIVSMVSNTFLQIFTTHGEFYAPSPQDNALTPANFSIKSQSQYGSANLQARQFDQTTVFVTRKARGLREFIFDAIQGSYAADALTFMSKALLTDPVDLDVQMEGEGEEQESRAYISNTDGTIAVLSKVKKENIAGWSYWDTEGAFQRLGVIDSEVWAIVQRTVDSVTSSYLEILSGDRMLDFSGSLAGTPSTTWGPFDLHKGATVHAVSGDLYLGTFLVDATSGMIELPTEVMEVEIGFNFVPEIVPLQQHVMLPDGITMGWPKRNVSVTAMLIETLSCRIKNRNLPNGLPSDDPGIAPPRFNGKFRAQTLGWGAKVAVSIKNPYPLPFTLNTIVTEVEV